VGGIVNNKGRSQGWSQPLKAIKAKIADQSA